MSVFLQCLLSNILSLHWKQFFWLSHMSCFLYPIGIFSTSFVKYMDSKLVHYHRWNCYFIHLAHHSNVYTLQYDFVLLLLQKHDNIYSVLCVDLSFFFSFQFYLFILPPLPPFLNCSLLTLSVFCSWQLLLLKFHIWHLT